VGALEVGGAGWFAVLQWGIRNARTGIVPLRQKSIRLISAALLTGVRQDCRWFQALSPLRERPARQRFSPLRWAEAAI
jgi:hypothetical protein